MQKGFLMKRIKRERKGKEKKKKILKQINPVVD